MTVNGKQKFVWKEITNTYFCGTERKREIHITWNEEYIFI